MKEKEYILATNLAKARMAQTLVMGLYTDLESLKYGFKLSERHEIEKLLESGIRLIETVLIVEEATNDPH